MPIVPHINHGMCMRQNLLSGCSQCQHYVFAQNPVLCIKDRLDQLCFYACGPISS